MGGVGGWFGVLGELSEQRGGRVVGRGCEVLWG